MDHRALVNVVAFVVGFLWMVALGVAMAADPVPYYVVSGVLGNSTIKAASAGCVGLRATVVSELQAEFGQCLPASVPFYTSNYVKNGKSTTCDGVTTCTWYYDLVTDGSSSPDAATVYGAVVLQDLCWDGSDPVSGVCPDPPTCTVGETMQFSVPGDSLVPLCRDSCRWENSGVGLCVAGSCFSEYTSTGDVCTVGAPGTPLSDGTEWIDSPETQTATDDPAPVTDGDTVTDQRTVTTQTDEAVKRETVNNQTTITETSVHGVTKTTTTTTTTHADGSQTVTETVSYQRTDPAITTTRIGSGGSVTTQPGETVTGSRTTTSVVGADGSVTSTTTETGVGGDGEGGPEDESGECGILPQVVCDFLDSDGVGEEHPSLPVQEVGGEMVAYDSGLGGGSCPGSVGTSFMGQSISYDYSDACYVATTYFRPILLAIAAIAAAFIIVGARL